MSFLHPTRLFLNDVLSLFGLAMNRVGKQRWKWFRVRQRFEKEAREKVHEQKSVLTIQVGCYSIQIPSESPLSTWYGGQALEIGRLTILVKRKFPFLAVIDIGANVGDTACIIKTAEDVPILCIEGDEYTFSFLQKNIAQFENVTARNVFLGETTKKIKVNFQKSGWNLTLKPNENSAQTVNLTKLDDFIFCEPGWQAFKLVKIDAEGFDCAIIRGATNFLRAVHPVIHFEYNRGNMDPIGETGIDTLLLLSDLGYSQLAVHDANGRFFCSTTLSEKNLIEDLHDYADSVHGGISHYDITAFHRSDSDLAAEFQEIERHERRKKPV
jgi:FkbM family methyltransferase